MCNCADGKSSSGRGAVPAALSGPGFKPLVPLSRTIEVSAEDDVEDQPPGPVPQIPIPSVSIDRRRTVDRTT